MDGTPRTTPSPTSIADGAKPTLQVSNELQTAFDHFNAALFDGQLPQCLITLQRKANCFGYFARRRFVSVDGDVADELAVNPDMLASYTLLETLQTVVHEMAHGWQFHFGTPGRRGYHNREWADKMESIGLMPSSTGKPGGARLGEKMADYPILGGRFLAACKDLLTQDFRVSWYDRLPMRKMRQAAPDLDADATAFMEALEEELGIPLQQEMEAIQEKIASVAIELVELPASSTRHKYRCGGECGAQVWGKPGLRITCDDCDEAFTSLGPA